MIDLPIYDKATTKSFFKNASNGNVNYEYATQQKNIYLYTIRLQLSPSSDRFQSNKEVVLANNNSKNGENQRGFMWFKGILIYFS